MIAVADTGPLRYLSLIGQIGLLPHIFEEVLIPNAVANELSQSSTPQIASDLILHCPSWLKICSVPSVDPSLNQFNQFGHGEFEAITLALSVQADVLLTDDRAAKNIATQTMGIAASGTIGILYEAVINDLVPFTAANFDESIVRLQTTTNFRFSRSLRKTMDELSRRLNSLLLPRSTP
jgi:predicted nucleic acid-binding protein